MCSCWTRIERERLRRQRSPRLLQARTFQRPRTTQRALAAMTWPSRSESISIECSASGPAGSTRTVIAVQCRWLPVARPAGTCRSTYVRGRDRSAGRSTATTLTVLPVACRRWSRRKHYLHLRLQPPAQLAARVYYPCLRPRVRWGCSSAGRAFGVASERSGVRAPSAPLLHRTGHRSSAPTSSASTSASGWSRPRPAWSSP